eukprot:3751096-Prorocentrum_lima.AAC.1
MKSPSEHCQILWLDKERHWLDSTCMQADKEAGHEAGRGTDKVTLEDQDGKEIILNLHFGLPCMEWDDFS